MSTLGAATTAAAAVRSAATRHSSLPTYLHHSTYVGVTPLLFSTPIVRSFCATTASQSNHRDGRPRPANTRVRTLALVPRRASALQPPSQSQPPHSKNATTTKVKTTASTAARAASTTSQYTSKTRDGVRSVIDTRFPRLAMALYYARSTPTLDPASRMPLVSRMWARAFGLGGTPGLGRARASPWTQNSSLDVIQRRRSQAILDNARAVVNSAPVWYRDLLRDKRLLLLRRGSPQRLAIVVDKHSEEYQTIVRNHHSPDGGFMIIPFPTYYSEPYYSAPPDVPPTDAGGFSDGFSNFSPHLSLYTPTNLHAFRATASVFDSHHMKGSYQNYCPNTMRKPQNLATQAVTQSRSRELAQKHARSSAQKRTGVYRSSPTKVGYGIEKTQPIKIRVPDEIIEKLRADNGKKESSILLEGYRGQKLNVVVKTEVESVLIKKRSSSLKTFSNTLKDYKGKVLDIAAKINAAYFDYAYRWYRAILPNNVATQYKHVLRGYAASHGYYDVRRACGKSISALFLHPYKILSVLLVMGEYVFFSVMSSTALRRMIWFARRVGMTIDDTFFSGRHRLKPATSEVQLHPQAEGISENSKQNVLRQAVASDYVTLATSIKKQHLQSTKDCQFYTFDSGISNIETPSNMKFVERSSNLKHDVYDLSHGLVEAFRAFIPFTTFGLYGVPAAVKAAVQSRRYGVCSHRQHMLSSVNRAFKHGREVMDSVAMRIAAFEGRTKKSTDSIFDQLPTWVFSSAPNRGRRGHHSTAFQQDYSNGFSNSNGSFNSGYKADGNSGTNFTIPDDGGSSAQNCCFGKMGFAPLSQDQQQGQQQQDQQQHGQQQQGQQQQGQYDDQQQYQFNGDDSRMPNNSESGVTVSDDDRLTREKKYSYTFKQGGECLWTSVLCLGSEFNTLFLQTVTEARSNSTYKEGASAKTAIATARRYYIREQYRTVRFCDKRSLRDGRTALLVIEALGDYDTLSQIAQGCQRRFVWWLLLSRLRFIFCDCRVFMVFFFSWKLFSFFKGKVNVHGIEISRFRLLKDYLLSCVTVVGTQIRDGVNMRPSRMSKDRTRPVRTGLNDNSAGNMVEADMLFAEHPAHVHWGGVEKGLQKLVDRIVYLIPFLDRHPFTGRVRLSPGVVNLFNTWVPDSRLSADGKILAELEKDPSLLAVASSGAKAGVDYEYAKIVSRWRGKMLSSSDPRYILTCDVVTRLLSVQEVSRQKSTGHNSGSRKRTSRTKRKVRKECEGLETFSDPDDIREKISRLFKLANMTESASNKLAFAKLDWQLHVVDEDSIANAFITDSGKIFVFTGVIKLCERVISDINSQLSKVKGRKPNFKPNLQDMIAAILAHELSHALSRHGQERYVVKSFLMAVIRLTSTFVRSALACTLFTLGGVSVAGLLNLSRVFNVDLPFFATVSITASVTGFISSLLDGSGSPVLRDRVDNFDGSTSGCPHDTFTSMNNHSHVGHESDTDHEVDMIHLVVSPYTGIASDLIMQRVIIPMVRQSMRICRSAAQICEWEADIIGIYLMACADFDPRSASLLWQYLSDEEESALSESKSTDFIDSDNALTSVEISSIGSGTSYSNSSALHNLDGFIGSSSSDQDATLIQDSPVMLSSRSSDSEQVSEQNIGIECNHHSLNQSSCSHVSSLPSSNYAERYYNGGDDGKLPDTGWKKQVSTPSCGDSDHPTHFTRAMVLNDHEALATFLYLYGSNPLHSGGGG